MDDDKPALKLYLFGLPRLEREEQPVQISRRKSLAALALCAAGRRPGP